MRVSGKTEKVMEEGSLSILMALFTKDISKKAIEMAWVELYMLMAITTSDSTKKLATWTW